MTRKSRSGTLESTGANSKDKSNCEDKPTDDVRSSLKALAYNLDGLSRCAVRHLFLKWDPKDENSLSVANVPPFLSKVA